MKAVEKYSCIFGAMLLSCFVILALPQEGLAVDSLCKAAQLADINNDDVVNYGDITQVLAQWGAPKPNNSDTNRNGAVDFGDIFTVIQLFGPVSARCANAIEVCEDLDVIRNDLSADYVLTCDINLQGIELAPIGTIDEPFSGTLNGQDFSIANFVHASDSQDKVGFFGSVVGGIVRNLNLENAQVTSTNANDVGLLAGFTNTTLIENCTSSGSVSGTGERTGGLVGHIDPGSILRNSSSSAIVQGGERAGAFAGVNHGGLVENCSASGNVSGTEKLGGLLGYSFPDQNNGNATITRNCSASGDVNGEAYVGGLIGYHLDGVIEGSNASGAVTASVQYGGGFVGRTDIEDTVPLITNSHATGAVTGAFAVAGFVGYHGDGSIIRDSSASGNASTTDHTAGGFIGYLTQGAIVENSSSSGNAVGEDGPSQHAGHFVGGFVGHVNEGTVIGVTSTGSAIGISNVGGLVGKVDQDIDISDSQSFGSVVGAGSNVGGFAGFIGGNVIVDNSFSHGDVTGGGWVGGFAGSVSNNVVITHSGTESNVVFTREGPGWTWEAGGFVGSIRDAQIQNSFARGDITGLGDGDVGGFVGEMDGVIIERSYYSGSISAQGLAGGFVGEIQGEEDDSPSLIRNCYSIGEISSVGPLWTTGFLATTLGPLNNVIQNSFSAMITAGGAGAVQNIEGAGALQGFYFDAEVAQTDIACLQCDPQPAGATGLTTTQMQNPASFLGFDFKNIWAINPGESYPYLQWQDGPAQ